MCWNPLVEYAKYKYNHNKRMCSTLILSVLGIFALVGIYELRARFD